MAEILGKLTLSNPEKNQNTAPVAEVGLRMKLHQRKALYDTDDKTPAVPDGELGLGGG
jgi:hypothetical protein